MRQRLRDHDDADFVLFRGVEDRGCVRERHGRDADGHAISSTGAARAAAPLLRNDWRYECCEQGNDEQRAFHAREYRTATINAAPLSTQNQLIENSAHSAALR